jgi:cation-transporting ATPase E
MIGLGFPYEPSQVSLTLFTVGIPTLLLTLWARSETPQQDLIKRLVRFVMPVAIVTAIIGVGIYTYFYTHILTGTQNATIPVMALARWSAYTGLNYKSDASFAAAAATIAAQTALSTFVSLVVLDSFYFSSPPPCFLRVGAK